MAVKWCCYDLVKKCSSRCKFPRRLLSVLLLLQSCQINYFSILAIASVRIFHGLLHLSVTWVVDKQRSFRDGFSSEALHYCRCLEVTPSGITKTTIPVWMRMSPSSPLLNMPLLHRYRQCPCPCSSKHPELPQRSVSGRGLGSSSMSSQRVITKEEAIGIAMNTKAVLRRLVLVL